APPPGEIVSLKKLWQFDPDPTAPKTEVHRFTSNRREGPSNGYGMPVFVDGRLFLGSGGDLWWGKVEAWFRCIDAIGTDGTQPAEVWKSPLERHTMSTGAVTDELVFTADCGKLVHCLDRKTGKALWTHELKGEIWASP